MTDLPCKHPMLVRTSHGGEDFYVTGQHKKFTWYRCQFCEKLVEVEDDKLKPQKILGVLSDKSTT